MRIMKGGNWLSLVRDDIPSHKIMTCSPISLDVQLSFLSQICKYNSKQTSSQEVHEIPHLSKEIQTKGVQS